MTTLNKALIGLLVAQLALVAFVLTRGESATIRQLEPILTELSTDKVERIEIFKEPIDGKDSEIAIELHKKAGAWALKSHFDYPADESKVTDLLDKVVGLKSRGPVATSKARQTQLAVADNDYKRKLVIHGGGEPTIIYVGNPAGSRKTALRVSGQDDIHGVTGFSMASISAFVSGWLDTQYFKTTDTDVASIYVKNAQGEFALERDGGSWKLAGSPAAPPEGGAPATPAAGEQTAEEIDSEAVNELVKKMTDIRLAEPADPNHKLEAPLASVKIAMKPPEPAGGADAGPPAMSVAPEEHSFEIGSAEDGRYYLRRVGDTRAVFVYSGNLDPVVEFNEDKLYGRGKDKEEEGGADAPPALPGGLPGGLPPGGLPGLQ